MNVAQYDILEGAIMSKKQLRKVSLIVGTAAGALADGYLRLTSGDEGNLLVHTVVFLGGVLLSAGAVYGILRLWDVFFLKKR